MKILIADDEYLARSSLRSMLEELDLALEIVGEAADGEELASLVGQHCPDIAFVDIRMPKLNGLETIKLAKSISPQTRWYILTGFPEFDYAQEAIRLGVSGYLLKPVHPEELNRVLSDCIEQGRRQKAAQNKQFERELMALYHGLTLLELEEQDSFITKAHFVGTILYLDSHLPEKIKAERQFRFCRSVQDLICARSDNYNRMALFVLPGGELATVCAWDTVHPGSAEGQAWSFLQELERQVRASRDPDLAITALVTQECPDYPALQSGLERLREISALRVVCGLGRKLDLSILNQQAAKPHCLEVGSLLLDACRCYQERNYLGYMKALQKLEKSLRTAETRAAYGPAATITDFIARSIDCELDPAREAGDWLEALKLHGERLLGDSQKDELHGADIIDQVIKYVDENFVLDIGIGQIAEQLKITPNYLSSLFHKKTGNTFMSYLKSVRLLKARELLANPGIQVQQVAEQVGYFSTRHFARLFSEQFGCLPSEFRDRSNQP